MQFLFNSDNQTLLGSGAAEEVQAIVETRLDRISERLTRVEVHVSDVDGHATAVTINDAQSRSGQTECARSWPPIKPRQWKAL